MLECENDLSFVYTYFGFFFFKVALQLQRCIWK